jgi:hypothetical protein
LDEPTGPTFWDKPLFAAPNQEEQKTPLPNSAEMYDLSEGKYDSLFLNADKASEIYHAALDTKIIPSSVKLLKSDPVMPDTYSMPSYPKIAALVRLGSVVILSMQIGNDGKPINIIVEKGPKLLIEAVKKAVSDWKYPNDATERQVHVEIQFSFNCPGGKPRKTP